MRDCGRATLLSVTNGFGGLASHCQTDLRTGYRDLNRDKTVESWIGWFAVALYEDCNVFGDVKDGCKVL